MHIPQDIHQIRKYRDFNIDTDNSKQHPPESLPYRPTEFNKQGKEVNVTLNTFNVIQAPTVVVHQYDVAWGGETDYSKRALVKKIWNSKAVKAALGEPSNLWIYDGNKLAW